MIKVIGVRFKQAGKIHYYSPGKLDIKVNDKVIAETARGREIGTVVTGIKHVDKEEIEQPLKMIDRMATEKDMRAEKDNKNREEEAIEICREKVRAHGLQMKIIQVEFTFDNSKVLFYFTADGRIDFRELVKDLASVFRTRIELRQIGVRDETKIRGGIGVCGRELCCNKYLVDFSPVSIKMAKDQNISLNPTKISGACGRLMCCLSNEEATYEELNENLPAIGSKVETKDGNKGEVINVAILKQMVKVMFVKSDGQKEFKEISVEELNFKGNRKQQLSEQSHYIDESVANIIREDHIKDNKSKKNNKPQYNKNNRKDKDGNGLKKHSNNGSKSTRDGINSSKEFEDKKQDLNTNKTGNKSYSKDRNQKGRNQNDGSQKGRNQNDRSQKDRSQKDRNQNDGSQKGRNQNDRNQNDGSQKGRNQNDRNQKGRNQNDRSQKGRNQNVRSQKDRDE